VGRRAGIGGPIIDYSYVIPRRPHAPRGQAGRKKVAGRLKLADRPAINRVIGGGGSSVAVAPEGIPKTRPPPAPRTAGSRTDEGPPDDHSPSRGGGRFLANVTHPLVLLAFADLGIFRAVPGPGVVFFLGAVVIAIKVGPRTEAVTAHAGKKASCARIFRGFVEGPGDGTRPANRIAVRNFV